MRHWILLLLIILGGSFFFMRYSAAEPQHDEVAQDQRSAAAETVEETAPKEILNTYIIQDGDTFATAVEQFDIDYATMLAMVEAASSTYDLTRIRVGQPLTYVTNEAEQFKALRYEPNNEEIIAVKKTANGFAASTSSIVYDLTPQFSKATISSSLFMAGLDAGLDEVVIMDLVDIFAWSIDFATVVQKGDRYTVLYEERSRDGKPAGYGDVLAATFTNGGKTYTAYRYEDESGTVGYYSKDGESLIKQFLKAPLNYRRISSGFSYARFHPTLGRTTPHRAIDYAAAMGTPIMAVGDGVVRYVGWNGGYGKFISIRHNDTYTTNYAHLSGYTNGLRVGQAVTQGEVIGYVGSTGFSTGPHLHYEIEKNGTKVNPLDVELPAGDPIPEGEKLDFYQLRDKYNAMMTKMENFI